MITLTPVCASELSLDSVISQAKQYNPTFKKADANLKAAKQSYYSAYTNFLPQLSASAGTGQSYSDITEVASGYGFSRSNNTQLTGSLTIFNGLGDYSNVKMQKASLEIAQAAYKRACSDMIYQLKKDFYQLLWAQETIKLSQEILKMQKDNMGMIQLKYESGTEDLGSLKRVQADEFDSEFQLAKAIRYLKGARVQLISDIGDSTLSDATVTGSFDIGSPDTGTPLSLLTQNTPEYLASLYSYQRADWGVTNARSEFFPSVSLSAGTGKLGPDFIPLGNFWNFGLTATYAFFPGGKNFFDTAVAASNRRAAAQALIETEHLLLSKLQFALNDLFDSQGNREDVKKHMDAAQLQLEIVTQNYINGLETYQTWYIIQNDFINFKRSFLNSQRDAAISMATWNDLLGLGE